MPFTPARLALAVATPKLNVKKKAEHRLEIEESSVVAEWRCSAVMQRRSWKSGDLLKRGIEISDARNLSASTATSVEMLRNAATNASRALRQASTSKRAFASEVSAESFGPCFSLTEDQQSFQELARTFTVRTHRPRLFPLNCRRIELIPAFAGKRDYARRC